MKNLVIGSSGFIGGPLCKYLESQNEIVTEFDIQNNRLDDARYREFPFKNFDRVYFLAWNVGGAKYLYDDNTQFSQLEWNVKLLTNILPQLKRDKTKFMFVSSHLSDNTHTVYGVTKRLGEIWTSLINGINIRLWNIYGQYESESNKSHVVADFIHQALTKNCIQMLTTGEERRQFIHIDDLVYIMKWLMDNKKVGTYDITTNHWITIYRLAEMISDITGCKIQRGFETGHEVKIEPQYLLNNWTPKIQLYDGLQTTIEQYRKSII